MGEASPEQQAILDNPSRIRIVRAAPGSGKTWLVGELIRRELLDWKQAGGIAALSFTRVGGEEIRKAVGYELDHPHFVGTIDAFLFRYVIRPFLTKVFPGNFAKPRLIPANWEPNFWNKGPGNSPISVSTQANNIGYNLLEITYQGAKDGKPIIATPKPFGGGFDVVPLVDYDYVWKSKKDLWKSHGWITHADTAFLAYCILVHKDFGTTVCNQISHRFPFIVVDELQDTGFFLGKTISALLVYQAIRALLVGDPDQAIYEFNGARPELFDGFAKIDGAEELALGSSRRCPQNVIHSANHLRSTTHVISANQAQPGKSLMLVYNDMVTDTQSVLAKISSAQQNCIVKCLVRSNSNVMRIKSAKQPGEFGKLRCPALEHMSRAVRSFKNGNNPKALAQASACIALWLFQYEGIDEAELKSKGISPDTWKQIVTDCLLDCARINVTKTYEEWQKEAGRKIEIIQKATKLSSFTGTPKQLKPQNIKDRAKSKADDQMTLFLPSPPPKNNLPPIQTVHAVKGETHDLTVFVVPPKSKGVKCPSEVWWNDAPQDLEERRIAYVAMTRSRKDLILLVSESTVQKFQKIKKDFYDSFEVMTVAQFLEKPWCQD